MSNKKPYRLILTLNGNEKASYGSFVTETKGRQEMTRLSEESFKNTIIYKKYISAKIIEECTYELVLIKKREDNDPKITTLRNEIGKYVEHESSNDMWMIVDKMPFFVEEEFWVYGYHPLTDRKDFSFIFDNLIAPYASKRECAFSMSLFKNKVLFESNEKTDLVICKNKSDAIRLYNTIQDKVRNERKYKYIMCFGDCNSSRVARNNIVEKIMDLTNWNKQKIMRQSTKTQTFKGHQKV